MLANNSDGYQLGWTPQCPWGLMHIKNRLALLSWQGIG